MIRNSSGTARRLTFAFGSLIVFYGAASYFALTGFGEIHDGLHRMKDKAESVRLALELSSAVRDQYAHQAHTIIIGNESHLHLYDAAEARVLELTRQVRTLVERNDERGWLDDIEGATGQLDAVFRQRIVPAVVRGEQAYVQREHAQAQEYVSRIQERVHLLVSRFQADIGDFQEHASAVQHATVRRTLVVLIAAPVLAALVGAYIGRSVARPVARLREGAARVAQGDLSTRIDIDTPDEFGDLARQFNAMTASLKEHQERLVESEKLAGIGRLAAGVAHEINNPLGVILGYTRLLKKKADQQVAEDLRIIEDETLRCQEIVEGLLDLSRPMQASSQDIDLREMCEEVVARLSESKQLEDLDVTIEGSASTAGDARKLRQVLLNLVKNAAEAASAGGRVDVQLATSGTEATVAISDTGPGLSAAARERLFEPFFTTKPLGTGLGLAVSRAIARAHHGELEAGSAPGGGARFCLRLPRPTVGRS